MQADKAEVAGIQPVAGAGPQQRRQTDQQRQAARQQAIDDDAADQQAAPGLACYGHHRAAAGPPAAADLRRVRHGEAKRLHRHGDQPRHLHVHGFGEDRRFPGEVVLAGAQQQNDGGEAAGEVGEPHAMADRAERPAAQTAAEEDAARRLDGGELQRPLVQRARQPAAEAQNKAAEQADGGAPRPEDDEDQPDEQEDGVQAEQGGERQEEVDRALGIGAQHHPRRGGAGGQRRDQAEREGGGDAGSQMMQGGAKRLGNRKALGAQQHAALEVSGRGAGRVAGVGLVERRAPGFLVQPRRLGQQPIREAERPCGAGAYR